MFRGTRKEANKFLHNCQDALELARASRNHEQISIALANLGLALFEVRRFEDGLAKFDESLETARSVGSRHLQAQCLGIKALAYQMIERYPDAYNVADEVRTLGEENGDDGLIFDALTSQGQILLESGEPIIALERFQAAEKIAASLKDSRRSMQLKGALGNYSLQIGSPDKALGYFQEALRTARERNDQDAEMGFLGNIGTMLSWQGRYEETLQPFEDVLAYVRASGDVEVEIHALKYLAIAHSMLKNDIEALMYGEAGLKLAKGVNDEVTIVFLEKMILAHYRLGRVDEAQELTRQAIEIADSIDDQYKKVDLQLGFGESLLLIEMYDQALSVYQDALAGAIELGRKKDSAYLTGRLGVVYAELGELENAIEQHEKSLDLARAHSLSELEGEQLIMLSMVSHEQGELKRALDLANQASDVYLSVDLKDESEKVRQWIEQIQSSTGDG